MNCLLSQTLSLSLIIPSHIHSCIINDDEVHGVRPEEFPDEAMKVKCTTGWHAEYQHFTDNLPVHLRERIMVCDHPDEMDVFSNKVIQKAMMLRI